MGETAVVISRKHKRLRKGTHLGLFLLTGGASAPFTAVRATQIASYNGTTRRLQNGRKNPVAAAVAAQQRGTQR